jgi:hypothetical protein
MSSLINLWASFRKSKRSTWCWILKFNKHSPHVKRCNDMQDLLDTLYHCYSLFQCSLWSPVWNAFCFWKSFIRSLTSIKPHEFTESEWIVRKPITICGYDVSCHQAGWAGVVKTIRWFPNSIIWLLKVCHVNDMRFLFVRFFVLYCLLPWVTDRASERACAIPILSRIRTHYLTSTELECFQWHCNLAYTVETIYTFKDSNIGIKELANISINSEPSTLNSQLIWGTF